MYDITIYETTGENLLIRDVIEFYIEGSWFAVETSSGWQFISAFVVEKIMTKEKVN